MSTQAEVKPAQARPAPKSEATAPRDAEPPEREPELKCTICGLRACWTK